jgi:ribosomal protein S18 acetylase RimI-like enzyme
VWQEAAQAIRFYQKHGFEIVGRSVFMVGDDPKEDWVMKQTLPQG